MAETPSVTPATNLTALSESASYKSKRWTWRRFILVHYNYLYWKPAFGACYYPRNNQRGFMIGYWRICWADRPYKQFISKGES